MKWLAFVAGLLAYYAIGIVLYVLIMACPPQAWRGSLGVQIIILLAFVLPAWLSFFAVKRLFKKLCPLTEPQGFAQILGALVLTLTLAIFFNTFREILIRHLNNGNEFRDHDLLYSASYNVELFLSPLNVFAICTAINLFRIANPLPCTKERICIGISSWVVAMSALFVIKYSSHFLGQLASVVLCTRVAEVGVIASLVLGMIAITDVRTLRMGRVVAILGAVISIFVALEVARVELNVAERGFMP
jgi:hypothetical protein